MATDLYIKYKAERFENYPKLNPLSYILRKSELGKTLTTAEWNWLIENGLTETVAFIKDQECHRRSILNEIESELTQLKNNKFLSSPINTVPSLDSEVPLILYKMNVLEKLVGSEYSFIAHSYYNYNRYVDFIEKKRELGITDNIPFGEVSDNILSKLAKNINILASDIEFLIEHKADSFSTVIKSQFENLKIKYKVFLTDDTDSVDLSLFLVLQKIDESIFLDKNENKYLLDNGFNDVYNISQKKIFLLLKEKYFAAQDQDNNINSHLYKVLKKIEQGTPLPEHDVNYLKNRKLNDTVKAAFKNKADTFKDLIDSGSDLTKDDIEWCEQYFHKELVFKWLLKKYDIENYTKNLDYSLYNILKNLNSNKRLKDTERLWLIENKLLNRKTKIYVQFFTIEAEFSENEFKKSKNYWELVNASAQWRKAENPNHALSLTDKLDMEKIKPAKLKSALLTTRGGALRDMNRLVEAEKCAQSAIAHHPDRHDPYTLLGALCFDTGRYAEGTIWFEKAVAKGAKPQDQDSEIRRILQKNHDPKLITHLLNADPSRFAWAKSFANKVFHRNKG